MVLKPNDDIVVREIVGEILIVPVTSGVGDIEDKLYTLNPTGRAVWDCFNGKNSIDDITKLLLEKYDSNYDVIYNDVKGLADELMKRNILVDA